jgi:hypothetical protein
MFFERKQLYIHKTNVKKVNRMTVKWMKTALGKEEKLYRIEIIEDVVYFDENSVLGLLLASKFSNPLEFTKQNGVLRYKPKEGIIKKGIKGEVIKKWGIKFFSPDVDQEGIELFTPSEQPYILVPYKKVENHYKIIS